MTKTPFKMKGWSPFTKQIGNQLFDVTGDEGGKDCDPYKDKKGTWIYPCGYSKQKKYTERGQSKSTAQKR